MNEKSPVADRYRLDPGWAWLASPGGVIPGGALTFVRGMSVAEVFRTFDIDPDSARTMTARQALTDPVLQTGMYDEGPQWIRVAESGEWTVAVEYSQQKSYVDGISSHLAQNTEVVLISANPFDPAEVSYLSHGDFVFAFGCGAPYDSRAGSRPHMFDDEMFDAGLIDFPSRATIRDASVAMMAILGGHFGFSLTAETVNGPLPTAYRMHLYTPLRINRQAGAEAERSPKPPPPSPA